MKSRTSLVTIAAVAGTMLIGSAVVAANVGILNAADDSSLGELSATATVETTDPVVAAQVVDVYVQDPPLATGGSTTTTTAPDLSQEFTVDDAGSVRVGRVGDGIGVASVLPHDGWLWTAEQPDANTVRVTFTSGDSTYVFTAVVNPDGTIEADVEQPIIDIVRVPTPGGSASNSPAPAANVPNANDARTDDHGDDHSDDHGDDHSDGHDGDHDYEGGHDDD